MKEFYKRLQILPLQAQDVVICYGALRQYHDVISSCFVTSVCVVCSGEAGHGGSEGINHTLVNHPSVRQYLDSSAI